MEIVPDAESARSIISDLQNARTYSEVGTVMESLARSTEASAATLALAVASYPLDVQNQQFWEHKRQALANVLKLELTKLQIEAQDHLSVAADRLARRNYWVATASLIAAGLSLIVSMAQAFHWV